MADGRDTMDLHTDIPHRKNAAEWVMYAMVLPILWGMRLKRWVRRLRGG
jgi:hypothetical protein